MAGVAVKKSGCVRLLPDIFPLSLVELDAEKPKAWAKSIGLIAARCTYDQHQFSYKLMFM